MLASHSHKICRSRCLAAKHAASRANNIATCRPVVAQPSPAGSLSHNINVSNSRLPHPAPLNSANQLGRGATVVHAGRSAADRETPASPLTKSITKMIAESESLEELEDIVMEWRSSFDPIHVAAVFNKAAKHAGKQPQKAWPLARAAAKAWDQLLPSATPWSLASVLWGAAKLKFTDEMLWKDTVEAFVERRNLRAAKCLGLSNTAYALAVILQTNKGEVPGIPRSDLLDAMQLIMDEAYVFATSPDQGVVDSQQLANLLWACSHLHFSPGDSEVDALLQAYTRNEVLGQAIPMTVTSILHSVWVLITQCGYQPHIADRVWRKLLADELVVGRLASDTPYRVSEMAYNLICLWSFTPPSITTDIARDSMRVLLCGPVAQRLGSWMLLDVCTVLWACALLDMRDDIGFVQSAIPVVPKIVVTEKLGPITAQRLGIVHEWLVQKGIAGGHGLASVLTAEQVQECTMAARRSKTPGQ